MWTVLPFFFLLKAFWYLNEIYWSGWTQSNVTALKGWWNYMLTIRHMAHCERSDPLTSQHLRVMDVHIRMIVDIHASWKFMSFVVYGSSYFPQKLTENWNTEVNRRYLLLLGFSMCSMSCACKYPTVSDTLHGWFICAMYIWGLLVMVSVAFWVIDIHYVSSDMATGLSMHQQGGGGVRDVGRKESEEERAET